jgi:hypothetical protein
MYSYIAREAKLRKEAYLAKIRHSWKPSTEAHKRGAGVGACAKKEEATASLEDEDQGGRLYVAVRKGEEDGGGRGGRKLYVAIGKEEEDGRSNLLWAARNLLASGDKLILLHVHQPANKIMNGKAGLSLWWILIISFAPNHFPLV